MPPRVRVLCTCNNGIYTYGINAYIGTSRHTSRDLDGTAAHRMRPVVVRRASRDEEDQLRSLTRRDACRVLGIGGITLAGLGITGCSGSGDSADDSTEAAASAEAATTSYEDNITVEITSCGTATASFLVNQKAGKVVISEAAAYKVSGTLTNNNQDQGFDGVYIGVTASVPTTNGYGDSTGNKEYDCMFQVYDVEAGATASFDAYLYSNSKASSDFCRGDLIGFRGFTYVDPTKISEVALSGECKATIASDTDQFMSLSDCSGEVSMGTNNKLVATITNGSDHRCDDLWICFGAFASNGNILFAGGKEGPATATFDASYLEAGETTTAQSIGSGQSSYIGNFPFAVEDTSCTIKPLYAYYKPES